MDEDDFWGFVARLGGVADDATCRALHVEVVSAGRAAEFGTAVDAHVERLLSRCSVPYSHQGDTAEWIAAAVIAAGRSRYEEILAAGKKLRPRDWRWEDAEALLVVGFVDEDGRSSDPKGSSSWRPCSGTPSSDRTTSPAAGNRSSTRWPP